MLLMFGILIVFQAFSQTRNSNTNELSIQKMFFDLHSASENPLDVKKLNLAKNGLDSLPNSIKEFKNLELLILSDNNLHNLPIWFSELTELKYLYIDNNLFEEIPDVIYTLNNIQILDMSDNKLKSVSKDVNSVVSLQKLNTAGNRINFKKMQRIKMKINNCEVID